MSTFRMMVSGAPRRSVLSGGKITLRIDNDLVKRTIAEKAVRQHQAERQQFQESIAA